jgi:RNA polymerase sigma factor (sigma-70 family)
MQTQSPPFVKHLRRIIGQQTSGISDSQLLDRFIDARDESAFELLLWRHERMVLNVCRWVLGREQDAEDAFQATFLTLACKAGAVGQGEALASWLYKVAFRISLRARTRVVKRNQLEQHAADWLLGESTNDPPAQVAEEDLRRVVCEEVHRLPEKYQTPVVLCYFQGKTNEEAARQLHCPTGTVVTRLARARKRLHTRLSRRGVGIPAGLAAVPLACIVPSSSARAALLAKTVQAALHYSIHKGAVPGLVSAKVAALTKGALKTMLMTKLKFLAVTLLSVGLLGTGSAVWAFRPAPAEQQAPRDSDEGEPKAGAQGDRKEKKSHQQARVEEVVTKSFKTGTAPQLIVEMFNGSIDVVAKTEGTVEVRVTKRGAGKTEEVAKEELKKVDLQMVQDGDTIRIKAQKQKDEERSHEGHAGASAELQVPSGAVLDLLSGNGPITITGGSGAKKVHTSNGAIHVKDNTAAVDLATSNGAISVKGGKGSIKVKTSNGPIDVRTDNSSVDARTSNGSVHFAGALASGQHTFHTSNGTVSIVLAPDAHFRVEARTSHGKITSDFFEVKRSRGRGETRASAEIGEDPKTSIKIETSNGNVEIRKSNKSSDEDRSEEKGRKQEKPSKKRETRTETDEQ